MDIRKLQRAIVDGLEDVKGQNIVVFNTEHLSALFERVVIASGASNRQTKALAASVRDAVKASGFPILRTEGEGNGEWIIVDCGAAVVHLMQPSIRSYYHLEEIWGDKPVRMKLDTAPTRLVKAAEPDGAEPQQAVPPRRRVNRLKAGTTAAAAGGEKPAAAPRARSSRAAAPSGGAAAQKVAGRATVLKTAGRTTAPKAAGRAAAPRRGSTVSAGSGITRTVGVKKARSEVKPAVAKRPASASDAGARKSTGQPSTAASRRPRKGSGTA